MPSVYGSPNCQKAPNKQEAFLAIARNFHPYLMKYLEMIVRGRIHWGRPSPEHCHEPGYRTVSLLLRKERNRNEPA